METQIRTNGKDTAQVETKKTRVRAEKPKTEVKVYIPEMKLNVVELAVEGITPLIMHKFAEKARKQMAGKQQMKAAHVKEARDPEAEFRAALHEIKPGVYGFPAGGFKKACVSACKFASGIKTGYAKGAFHVIGGTSDLVQIEGSEPRMQTDTVRIGGMSKVTSLAYRPVFDKWRCKLKIRYNASAISPDQIANLLNIAGFAVGIGDWRPERGGSYGQFQVVGVR